MKGIILYEDYRGKKVVEAIKLGEVDYTCKSASSDDGWINELSGIRMTSTQAYCNKEDTYDFETGALIALMKMCGVEKVVRAFNEVFPKETYNTYITKFEGELCELKKEYDKVNDLKEYYKKNYEDVKEHYDKLGDRNKYLIEDINKKLEYIKEKDEEIKRLEASNCAKGILNGKLLKDYNTAQNAYEVMVEKSADLMDKVKKLEEEVKRLKGESESHWKKYQRNIQKKQDRINELERVYKASNDDEAKLVEYYQREIKKFEEENEKLKGNINELFESDKYSKSLVGKLSFEKHRLEEENEKLKDEVRLKKDAINEWKQTLREQNTKIGDLVCENEKLKLDCEKLQHGYNDMIICGGMRNGKQYTLLVDLFKKLDQKKVDAAYKEAYNTTLPVWQKEFLNQMYGIYKESKEKIELPRTLDINGTVYRKSIQIKDFGEQINKLTVDSLIEQSRAFTRKCVDEWFYKIPTKREEMWGNILGATKCPPVDIKVAKQDITTFLRELQDKIPEVMWNGSDCPLTDYTNPYWFKHDYIYFALFRYDDTGKLKLCYSEEHHSWIKTTIDYLPPMRWDLFKKGRLVAKVSKENYAEFCSRVFSHFDKVGVHAFNHDCKFGYFMFNKDTDYVERILASDHGDAKEINRHKVIDWEDVR